jgi:ubiquitin carboxyl-terminal hydrolase 25/28
VHEGNAESGHYYAFIFDRASNKWWRFNDFRVMEETWENVKLESFGSDANAKGNSTTAYSLIYVNEMCKQQMQVSPQMWH